MQCECCERTVLAGRCPCRCMDNPLCGKCNHCLVHCDCVESVPIPPYPVQAAEARDWWGAMLGVRF